MILIPVDVGLTFSNRIQDSEQKLQRKGCRWLIHVLDFIEEENGCLSVHNEEDDVVKDARCIIYPGVSSDLWWDHVQLLMQVDKAIVIFEEVHPNCIALFVFNQSSTHTSLRPDALRAFDMNQSNGGKQQKQKDTMILMNNPHPEFHGKAQKMTTDTSASGKVENTFSYFFLLFLQKSYKKL